MRAIRIVMAGAVAVSTIGVAQASGDRFAGATQSQPARGPAGLAGRHRLAQTEDTCTRASFSGCDVMRSPPPPTQSAPAPAAKPSPKADREREQQFEGARPKGKRPREQNQERIDPQSGAKRPQR